MWSFRWSQSLTDRSWAKHKYNLNRSLEAASSSLLEWWITEQTGASASVDPLGSIRVYMVLELKETRDGATVSVSKKEGKGIQ
jgi:hypothetical protein